MIPRSLTFAAASLFTFVLLILGSLFHPAARAVSTRPLLWAQQTFAHHPSNDAQAPAAWPFNNSLQEAESWWKQKWDKGVWKEGLPDRLVWEVPGPTEEGADLEDEDDDLETRQASFDSDAGEALAPMRLLTPEDAQGCMDNRWIMLVGDSTMRIFFATLVELLSDGQFPEDSMPSWRKLGCTQKVDKKMRQWCDRHLKGLSDWEIGAGQADEGFFRDVTVGATRLTFIFKTYGDTFPLLIPQLLGPGGSVSQPDLLVLQSGPWDRTRKTSIPIALDYLSDYVKKIKRLFEGPTAWLATGACSPMFTDFASSYREGGMRIMQEAGISVFDRSVTLQDSCVHVSELQEGWHSWGDLGMIQLQGFLRGLCAPSW
ncbi:hypothetical protein T439DRAFT_324059 [Meredithblackwellia eburnea MCA 4105]